MSGQAVRDAVRAEWATKNPGLPFYETINEALPEGDLPDVWGTLTFDTISRGHVTMGKRPWIEETGTVTFAVMSRSGDGEAAGVAAAQAITEAWDSWIDPTGNIWFDSVGAPRQIELETQGEWHLMGVACNYKAQYREPTP